MTFSDFYSIARTRNINYNVQKMQHLFTFSAPRNLNRKTLELFFSLNQRLSIRSFGRCVYALVEVEPKLTEFKLQKVTDLI